MSNNCPLICTLQTCPIQCGQILYLPTLPGNAAYAGILGAILLCQIGLGIFYRTWGFLIGMFCGLILEIIGYVGRIELHNNPFDFNNFLIYLIPLTIGPAFISGSIYLCLSRIIVAYGGKVSRFSPRTYSIIFMTSDFISLVLQGAGGGIAATANDDSTGNAGRYTMIAGLAFQVLSLIIFLIIWLEFILRVKKTDETRLNSRFENLRNMGWKFKMFNYALWLATILILIRSIYRVVELQGGFTKGVADNEIAFMILEGPMIILATLLLTIFHPGFCFQGQWHDASWSLRRNKSSNNMELEEKDDNGFASG